MAPRPATLLSWIHALGFCTALLSGGVLFVLAPRQAVSEGENRRLAPMPEFSWESLGRGEFTRKLDDFVADNFIFRQELTGLAGELRHGRGWALDEIRVFGALPPAAQKAPQPEQETTPPPPPPASPPQEQFPPPSQERDQPQPQLQEPPRRPASALEAAPLADQANAPYENVESIIIYRGRAVQMFGGTPAMSKPFISAVARYRQEFPQLDIYVMAIPIGADFYLPQKITHGAMRERSLVEHLSGALPAGVQAVNVYEPLAQRTSDYIYFRTDHHWTALGAFYAYQAFAQTAGFPSLPLQAFARREAPRFWGSLYHRTLSPALKASVDSVEYFVPPVEARVTMFSPDFDGGRPGHLLREPARGGGGYMIFLGGDYPLLRISTSAGTGRRIIVVKDSYGNAFIPFLAAHYEEIFVIDYRFFNGSIRALINEHGVQELLFAHNTYVLSSGYTAQRARSFLAGGGGGAPGLPASAGAAR